MGYSPWSRKESNMTEQLTHTYTHTHTHTHTRTVTFLSSLLVHRTKSQEILFPRLPHQADL